MSVFKEAYERIKFATNCKTQVEIAKILDIRQSSISDAKRRDSVPADWVVKLFEKFGLNPDWIKQGVGPMFLRSEEGYGPIEASAHGLAEDPAHFGEPMAKCTLLTVHDMVCTYTPGGEAPALPQLGKIALPHGFAKAGITIIRMNASNMHPIISTGAYMGVDTQATTPISGMAFALYSKQEGVIIRRLFLDAANDQYILRSDDTKYPEECVDSQKLKDRIIGKVSWVIQNL